MTTLADVGVSENLPEGQHLFVRHRRWSPGGAGSSTGEISACVEKSGALFHDLVTRRDDGLRRRRHRNERADASSRWRREKKHPSSRVPQIGRFNWHPDRYRPVIEFSSFVARASVDVRRAPLTQPSAEDVVRARGRDQYACGAGVENAADPRASRRRASSVGHRCGTCWRWAYIFRRRT